jgi:hypothetical protein
LAEFKIERLRCLLLLRSAEVKEISLLLSGVLRIKIEKVCFRLRLTVLGQILLLREKSVLIVSVAVVGLANLAASNRLLLEALEVILVVYRLDCHVAA